MGSLARSAPGGRGTLPQGNEQRCLNFSTPGALRVNWTSASASYVHNPPEPPIVYTARITTDAAMREGAEAKRARLIEAGSPELTRDARFGGPSKASLKKRVGAEHVWIGVDGDARTGLRAAPAVTGEDPFRATTWWWAVSKPAARPRPDTHVVLVLQGDGARVTLRVERASCGAIDSARVNEVRRASGTMVAVVACAPRARRPPRTAATDDATLHKAFASAKDVFLDV